MALEAPLRSSTGSLLSAFSPLSEMSSTSPADSHSLHPDSVQRVSASLSLVSPSDLVGPSPVTSNGTETTEIEDEESDEVMHSTQRGSHEPQLMMLKTNIPDQIRGSANEESVSVIHAPESFRSWTSTEPIEQQEETSERSSPKGSSVTATPDEPARKAREHATPPPLSTNVRPVRYSLETATPQAQNLRDVLNDSPRMRSSSTSSLGKIEEMLETEPESSAEADVDEYQDFMSYGAPKVTEFSSEVSALRTALQECWTLCNTLATLSSIQRARMFSSGTPDAHERAWRACWKLCQRLYDNKDREQESLTMQRMNLDLCRDFCQALFDIRQRQDEFADSILRVSFELNTHLYSAQDSRTLPEAFRERTLDFYITLCHRLMKQRELLQLPEDTDSLLRACWALAEMLFSLRQNKRDGRAADEELLGSAVQACWELCDIFREGCSSVRPDRNTPRASQTSFFGQQMDQSGRESRASNRSSLSKREVHKLEERTRRTVPPVPETPVTEFEDTPLSPESESPSAPNIMVLGTVSDSSRGGRWSSNASSLSGYSHSSAKTSSTATTATAEDGNVTRVKILVLKAAMIVGFNRDAVPDGKPGMASLQSFVKQLPLGSFGSLPSHASLLQSYKNLILSDAVLPRSGMLPARGRRASAPEIAKAVLYMMHRSSQYTFLRDLFRLVFNFTIDEVESRKNFSIVV
ncbi:uncharacterized protein DNG_05015 [Cephalotrichum gorgonifer]|uniref:DUF7624 domain-containing protein n=1 Tax=Cephalotrichum gorgonifer TaxID=2041049 RepID=A0AAE8SVW8_9PEZI|nr:uncharacterized protein DNG_05015 [Cephalotrichum gorgonifer]